ncbi:MAG: beta-ketoacyl synthase chain length factor [Pseudoxanthomonas sp.]
MLSAGVAGIGFWTRGLPSWEAARAYLADGALPVDAPAKPSPQLLAPNERRRTPETVAVALEVALAACTAAGRDPAMLSSVFASTHGDLTITDYMCQTLASEPQAISPTRFHNSVHNAAAGYWTIGTGAMAPATAISAYDASFAQGLLEAMAQLATGTDAVLLVGYDGAATGPLAQVSRSEGLLGGALLLVADPQPGMPRLRASIQAAMDLTVENDGALSRWAAGNAMLPMLPLFEALGLLRPHAAITAGSGKMLGMEIAYD